MDEPFWTFDSEKQNIFNSMQNHLKQLFSANEQTDRAEFIGANQMFPHKEQRMDWKKK